jgi:hypothetical protein
MSRAFVNEEDGAPPPLLERAIEVLTVRSGSG